MCPFLHILLMTNISFLPSTLDQNERERERESSGHENGTKIYVILTITTVCEFFTIKKDQDQTQFASSNT